MVTETAKERRCRLDHERYMREREKRLEKQHKRYWADVEKSRKYYRDWYFSHISRETKERQGFHKRKTKTDMDRKKRFMRNISPLSEKIMPRRFYEHPDIIPPTDLNESD